MSTGSKKGEPIRVGFILEVQDWLGGINYYRSLLSALSLLPEPGILPIMFAGSSAPESLTRNFDCVEIIRSKVLETTSLAGIARRLARKVFRQRDIFLDGLLRRHGINVLSHYSGALAPGTPIKTIGWIPDFQYLHLPELFTEADLMMRKSAVARVTDHCNRVILSSEVARQDLARVEPLSLDKSRVLHFVPQVDASEPTSSVSELEKRYGFQGPYFYLPNQFWAHKNHRLVIDALAHLKRRGISVTILATGNTRDHRFPRHFSDLMERVRISGLEECFRVLGVVPYGDLLSLMRHSLAVINPSLCEGWSTTVEEAKALDKAVLLSDIAVHREQNPAKGIFFDPRNANELAERMKTHSEAHEPFAGKNNGMTYASFYKNGRLAFAGGYQSIVKELCSARQPMSN
jgi:glycosyltransferase involved in cell wall biosynthesis